MTQPTADTIFGNLSSNQEGENQNDLPTQSQSEPSQQQLQQQPSAPDQRKEVQPTGQNKEPASPPSPPTPQTSPTPKANNNSHHTKLKDKLTQKVVKLEEFLHIKKKESPPSE
jgi:hypothetical protein